MVDSTTDIRKEAFVFTFFGVVLLFGVDVEVALFLGEGVVGILLVLLFLFVIATPVEVTSDEFLFFFRLDYIDSPFCPPW